ncbi:cathepsin D [Malassezia japonica]|uniref:Cathepsin D n=1 Tax=Malassezia japonica TaxID=223818 RepID=A0AAF0F0R6_9BASI|nr:cathepsin D [Malassezia japonica]WFD38372.1 cathepsin D [Malassezia japonica]
MQLSLTFVTALLLASGAVFASPVDTKTGTTPIELQRRAQLVASDGKLNVSALHHHFQGVENKYKTALNNYKRNTGKNHPLAKQSNTKRATGDVSLEDIEHEQLWAGDVTFGGQTFAIDFDTGSADTLANPGAYNPSRSSNSKNTHRSFYTSYGDGTNAQGTIYTDSFSIGGLNARDVAIGRSSNSFIGGENDNQGISGLAFPSIQSFPKQYPPFFESLRQQRAVSQGVFQFTLKAGGGSSLHLGGIDSSKYSGSISYADVDSSQGFWITDATVNGERITAIVDSGSTIISGPSDQVRSVVSNINGVREVNQGGQTLYVYDCSQTPHVTINIAGKSFTLSRDQTRYGTYDGQCVLPIAPVDGMPLNGWILGDTLFRSASVIFDVDRSRIGFANQA